MNQLPREVAESVQLLDLGCGVGQSLRRLEQLFGVSAIGLERSRKRVREAQEAGRRVYEADVLDLRPDDFPAVEYVVFDNVLEHLADLQEVEAALAFAASVASRLVYVRHPSFEQVDYLESLGLRQYWTDWPKAHTAPIRVHEFVHMANAIGVYQIVIQPVGRIRDAEDPTIIPSTAPPNQRKKDRGAYGVYDPVDHGPKPSVVFDRPVYFAFDIFFVTGCGQPRLQYRGDPEHDHAKPTVKWTPTGRRPVIGRR